MPTSKNLRDNLAALTALRYKITEQERKILSMLPGSGGTPPATADDDCPDKSDPNQPVEVYLCQLTQRILYDLGFWDSTPDPCQSYCDSHDECGGTT